MTETYGFPSFNVNLVWDYTRGRVNKKKPNLFLGEIDLFFFDDIAL